MTKMPKVSVIMAVYNSERHLKDAVDSILKQTFMDFEFIIVNDASTDRTEVILSQYSDKRIRILHNDKNIGLTKSLNKALRYSRGEYIARMDGDDISVPVRLERQVDYLDKNSDVYLISCSYREFGTSYRKNFINVTEHEIKAQYLFGSVLPHPGFMFRRVLLDEYGIRYNPEMKYAQDYDFQVRVSRKFHIACIPDILLYYRVSSSQISKAKKDEQREYANKVRYDVFRYYGIPCSRNQIALLAKVYYGERDFSIIEYVDILCLLGKIYVIMKDNTSKEALIINRKVKEYFRILKKFRRK